MPNSEPTSPRSPTLPSPKLAARRAIWTACTALRNEYRDVRRYVESTAMLLFFKLLDDQMLTLPPGIEALVPPEYRWSTLRALARADQATGHLEVHARLNDFFGSEKWKSSGNSASVFKGFTLDIAHPDVLAQAMNALDKLDPTSAHDQVGDLYEFLISKLSDAGVKGEFFTPVPVVDLVVSLLAPRQGMRVWDPACGTGGFLARAHDYVVADQDCRYALSPGEGIELVGNETDPAIARLARMNMLLRGNQSAQILELNSLSAATYRKPLGINSALLSILSEGGFDIVMANPPYGGHQAICDLLNVFHPWMRTSRPETNFLQLILHCLKPGGRCGVVLPEGILFRTDEVPLRRWILKTFKVEIVLSLPARTFEFAGIRTCVLIIRRPLDGASPDESTPIWFGEADSLLDDGDLATSILARTERDYARLVHPSEISPEGVNLRPRRYLGSAPGVSFRELTIDDIFEEVTDIPIEVQDDVTYTQVTVRYHGEGAVARRTLLGSEVSTKRQRRVRAGDVIFSKIDARYGAFAIVPPELDGAIVTPDFPTFRQRGSGRILPDLFKYYMRYGPYAKLLERESQGTTRRMRVTVDDIRVLPVPCPAMDEQEVLLRRLQHQDELLHLANKYKAIADSWDWLDSSLLEVDESLAVASSLADLVSNVNEYVEPASEPDRSWRVLSMSNVDGVSLGEIRQGNSFTAGRRYKLAHPGILAFAKDRVNVGTVGIVPEVGPHSIISPYRILVECVADLKVDWLFYLFKSPNFRQRIRNAQVGSVRDELSFASLLGIRVLVPPPAVQTEQIQTIQNQRQRLLAGAEAADEAEGICRRTISALFADMPPV